MVKPNIAVIFDANGQIAMVVHPDNDEQLNDPAFNPAGMVQVRVAPEKYAAAISGDQIKALALEPLLSKDPVIAQKVEASIGKEDWAKPDKP